MRNAVRNINGNAFFNLKIHKVYVYHTYSTVAPRTNPGELVHSANRYALGARDTDVRMPAVLRLAGQNESFGNG